MHLIESLEQRNYGTGEIYMEHFEVDDIRNIRKVYKMLEDEESKEIYLARLNYLVTRDYKYLKSIIEKYVPQVPALNSMTVVDLRRSLPENRKIILYGAGENAEATLDDWEGDERFIGFCDRDIEKQKSGLEGYPVIKPEQLLKMENVSVVISTHWGSKEIRNFLAQSGFPEDRIYEMGPYIVCGDTGQYFNPDFMTFGEEVFVDAGCKDLGTSLKLTKYCSHLKKVYAFEPDDSNYRDCLERKAAFTETDVEIFHCGTWSEETTLHFSATADGASHICTGGGTSIKVMPIDEVLGEERVTFIKMDVEGSELQSLEGARNTIQRDKPKLAICIYHKPEDMVTIPLYIKKLVPEYKFYVRHHSSGAVETVLYAVIP